MTPTFITWESLREDRAIRIIAPVELYPPGSLTPTQVPEDFAAYLLDLDNHGAVIGDVQQITVDGRPATVMTITTPTGLSGSLGCPSPGADADDGCFGAQPEFVLRLAVVDPDTCPFLVWQRDNAGDGQRQFDYTDFDKLLASIRFT